MVAGSSAFGVPSVFFERLRCSVHARYFGASVMRLKGDGLSDIVHVVCGLTGDVI